MKSSNKVLAWFGITLSALVILTVALTLTIGRQAPPALSESTPEGTVQQYLQAIQDKDYQKAWSLLAPSPTERPMTFDNWMSTFNAPYPLESSWKASLNKSTVSGNSATVDITIETFRNDGLLNNPVHSNRIHFTLAKSGERWLITSPGYIYWIY